MVMEVESDMSLSLICLKTKSIGFADGLNVACKKKI